MKINNHDINGVLEIDRIVHEPARLLILSYLSAVEYCDFIFLIKHTSFTKGNLSSHLRKLEDHGYVDVEKKIVDRKMNTVIKITETGREELSRYKAYMMKHLESII